MPSNIVTIILSILSQLPSEVAAVQQAIANVKSVLSAKDQATLAALFAAMNTKTDADYGKLQQDIGSATGTPYSPPSPS